MKLHTTYHASCITAWEFEDPELPDPSGTLWHPQPRRHVLQERCTEAPRPQLQAESESCLHVLTHLYIYEVKFYGQIIICSFFSQ